MGAQCFRLLSGPGICDFHQPIALAGGPCQYAPTRAFYRACGFHQEALLADFYDRNDGKVIFCKVLDPTSHR